MRGQGRAGWDRAGRRVVFSIVRGLNLVVGGIPHNFVYTVMMRFWLVSRFGMFRRGLRAANGVQARREERTVGQKVRTWVAYHTHDSIAQHVW